MSKVVLAFNERGLLVPGCEPYPMTLGEIQRAFGLANHARRNVFDGLHVGVNNLFDAGVERIILGGSFVSKKPDPRDADIGWWWHPGVDMSVLDPVFQTEAHRPAKGKFLIDFKIDGVEEVSVELTREYFLGWNMRESDPKFQVVGTVLIVRGDES